MKSQSKLIEQFKDGANQGTASHMFIDGDTLYSYGRHFPLAVRQQKSGQGYRFIINGDRYSVSTAAQQRQVLDLGPQIPYSALGAAQIDPYQIEVVDTRDDRWHTVPDPTPEDPDKTKEEHVLGAVLLSHNDNSYLSSTDDNEHWRIRSYFLSELPQQAQTIAEAYASLAPERVKEWNEDPKKPKSCRQGEWFFLPTDVKTRDLPRPTYRKAQLRDTSHYVSELRRLGDLYSRGVVRHRPEGRRRQHGPLKLGDTWHIALRNMAVGSWNAEGGVD